MKSIVLYIGLVFSDDGLMSVYEYHPLLRFNTVAECDAALDNMNTTSRLHGYCGYESFAPTTSPRPVARPAPAEGETE